MSREQTNDPQSLWVWPQLVVIGARGKVARGVLTEVVSCTPDAVELSCGVTLPPDQLVSAVRPAHALVYAVQYEIAARRAAREDKWPKTVGMELRSPEKNIALAALKQQYDRAYQHLRHLRRTGQTLQAAARLTTQRILRDAWMILLELPMRREKGKAAIQLGNSPTP